MHHASISFSRDARWAFVVTRDGWLNKVDLLELRIENRVRVGASTIGLTVTPGRAARRRLQLRPAGHPDLRHRKPGRTRRDPRALVKRRDDNPRARSAS